MLVPHKQLFCCLPPLPQQARGIRATWSIDFSRFCFPMRISYLGHDTRRAVDETHDESLSASGETLPQGLSPALLDLLAPLLLELVVEGEGGEALAQSARYLGESSRRASDDAGKNAPTEGKKWLFVHGASPGLQICMFL